MVIVIPVIVMRPPEAETDGTLLIVGAVNRVSHERKVIKYGIREYLRKLARRKRLVRRLPRAAV